MPVKIKQTVAVMMLGLPLVMLSARADDATEARLRDALRTTTEQLHRLEAENAALQASKSAAPVAAAPARNKEEAGAARTIADLKRRLAAAQEEAAKAKAASAEDVAASRKKESEQAAVIASLGGDKDRFTACAAKNEALVKLGHELLDRYENAGVGELVGRKEPFTGIKRVELQNLEQDARDKLRDNTVKP